LEVTQHTPQGTTQMVQAVEAETRYYMMRDHKLARFLPLRPHRIYDVCFSDAFFSSISPVRGYTMFQLFAFRDSKYDVTCLNEEEDTSK